MFADELIWFKFILTSVVVIGLSFIAEYISPRWAGILSGFPTGTAITLYFYGLENGLKFTGEAALHNMMGLIAMQMFIFCYYMGSKIVTKHNLLTSVITGFIGYFVSIFIISRFSIIPLYFVLIPGLSFCIFGFLLRKIKPSIIEKRIKVSWRVIFMRSGIAAIIVICITGVAGMVGETWAGLFSAFPTTLFPLLIIIHYSYGLDSALAIIKHVPEGLGSLLIYSLIIYFIYTSYPSLGLYLGMTCAFSGAIVYLFTYQILLKVLHRARERMV